jgi:transposase-like protein
LERSSEWTRLVAHSILCVAPGKECRDGYPSKYPEEVRREGVALYRSSDRPRSEVARSLGIRDGLLAAWVKAAERDEAPKALDPE